MGYLRKCPVGSPRDHDLRRGRRWGSNNRSARFEGFPRLTLLDWAEPRKFQGRQAERAPMYCSPRAHARGEEARGTSGPLTRVGPAVV